MKDHWAQATGVAPFDLKCSLILTQLDGGCRTSGDTSAGTAEWLFAILNMKTEVNVTENNFHNCAIRWQLSKHVKSVSPIFVLGLTVNEMLTFQIFDLEKAGQGH